MKVIGIIPARYASTRFPGKPLIDLKGKSMIQRVVEQCQQSTSLIEIIVATDDQRIFDAVIAFGGKVMMTSEQHQSGTDRCAEVAQQYPADVYVNIQGDEPLIDPSQIDLLVACFNKSGVELATLVKKIDDVAVLQNNNTPKVVLDSEGRALYFSRAAIPFQRNVPQAAWLLHQQYYKHIGIYGYTRKALHEITQLPLSSLEQAEALEQLRWLEAGYRIQTAITTLESLAIDSPDDVQNVLARL
jgi:3-deoxy-manno-octulosonate cytidylyltransferase (CMP-KDO synthetase)